MQVKLDYFKPNGKWCTEGEYREHQTKPLHEIWQDVKQMLLDKTLPGLCVDHSLFIVSVDVPEHEHNHPHLIVPW
jgi:hypothetical protein